MQCLAMISNINENLWLQRSWSGQCFAMIYDFKPQYKLVAAGEGEDDYLTVLGKTISTDDFYEGQVFLILICTGGSNGVLVLSHRPHFESALND